ncbi:MAG: hypothetical protein RI894_2571 [Bacteroidota bacterium]|jgi:hypothetical protein
MKKAIFLLSLAFFMACSSPSASKAKTVQLVCDDLDTDPVTEVPHSAVSLLVDGQKTPIDTINGCSTIEKAEYAQKQIPADAIAACGAWYAGAGDYFYVVLSGGKPVVFKGWQAEEQEDQGFHWEKVK